MATVKDIAERAGLGMATVSKYLNGGRVREQNRAAIEKAIRELGYQGGPRVRLPKPSCSSTVGVVIPELNNLYATTIVQTLEDELHKADYNVLMCDCRSSRERDTFFKRTTAEAFYRLMNALGAETVFNHADYRLLSRRALDGLARFKEVNLFLRGIVPMIGYPTGAVAYERGERFAGESKYPLKKMLSFAMEGITSLSTRPIRYITMLGFLIFLVSILMLVYSVVRWATGETIIGWASVICSVWAIGGLILLSLGVIGEYIGKIYLETKGRPRFLLREVLEDRDGQTD